MHYMALVEYCRGTLVATEQERESQNRQEKLGVILSASGNARTSQQTATSKPTASRQISKNSRYGYIPVKYHDKKCFFPDQRAVRI